MQTTIRASQSVHIGPDIRVHVIEVDADKRVRLGITAPPNLNVEASEDSAADRLGVRQRAGEVSEIVPLSAPRSIAQAAEDAVEEALQKPQLLAILTDLDRAFLVAQCAVETFFRSSHGLLDLHSGLVELHNSLAQARDQANLFGDEAREFYYSTSPRLTGYDTVMSLIRDHTRLLDDLLFALPSENRKSNPVIRRPRRPT